MRPLTVACKPLQAVAAAAFSEPRRPTECKSPTGTGRSDGWPAPPMHVAAVGRAGRLKVRLLARQVFCYGCISREVDARGCCPLDRRRVTRDMLRMLEPSEIVGCVGISSTGVHRA